MYSAVNKYDLSVIERAPMNIKTDNEWLCVETDSEFRQPLLRDPPGYDRRCKLETSNIVTMSSPKAERREKIIQISFQNKSHKNPDERRTGIHDAICISLYSSREIQDFAETHLCKLCVILRSRVLLGVSS